MAKVIRAFRERYDNLKRYNPGDEYPEKDKDRVAYLVQQGFLEAPKKAKKGKKSDADSDS